MCVLFHIKDPSFVVFLGFIHFLSGFSCFSPCSSGEIRDREKAPCNISLFILSLFLFFLRRRMDSFLFL